MIPLSDLSWQTQSWQWLLANAVRSPDELVRLLGLEGAPAIPETGFELIVPYPYLQRIEPGRLDDPLLRQVLPAAAELDSPPGYTRDPLGETTLAAGDGVLQKYAGRILVVATGACAINCRYCFRRHFPYADEQPGSADWDEIIARLAADDSVSEVILSGGDPLVMSDARLRALCTRLAAIPHVTTLRLHTRLPVVIPQRVCDDLIGWISELKLAVVIVAHVNHAREIDAPVVAAMARLADAGVTLLNQSVLLRGVNDSLAALTALSRALLDARILPYYLHQLDRVLGAAHFSVDDSVACSLIDQMRDTLPGYLVPRLTREIPGANAKTIIA